MKLFKRKTEQTKVEQKKERKFKIGRIVEPYDTATKVYYADPSNMDRPGNRPEYATSLDDLVDRMLLSTVYRPVCGLGEARGAIFENWSGIEVKVEEGKSSVMTIAPLDYHELSYLTGRIESEIRKGS